MSTLVQRFSFSQRVRYAETDAMGIAWHGNYLLWFEAARVEVLRAVGYPYTRLEQEGYGLPVVEAHLRYGRPARFDDVLTVEVWLEELKSRKMRLGYRVSNATDGSECASGYTDHICWRNGIVSTLPPELRAKFLSFR